MVNYSGWANILILILILMKIESKMILYVFFMSINMTEENINKTEENINKTEANINNDNLDSIITEYINVITKTVDPKYQEANLILDGGAVNGIVGVGAVLVIKKFEISGLIKIGKISGCSIGSLIGLWYACGCPISTLNYLSKMFNIYKVNKNFRHYKQCVKEIVYSILPKEDMYKINNKLFIKYYDVINCNEVVVSIFKNRKHLVKCLLRTAHLPYITSKQFILDNKYIDGIYPYFFKTPERNLFIQLFSFLDPLNIVYVKNESNILPRVIYGANQAVIFLRTGKSSVCNIIYSNNYYYRITFYMRLISSITILFLIEFFKVLLRCIPIQSTNTLMYLHMKKITGKLVKYVIDSIV